MSADVALWFVSAAQRIKDYENLYRRLTGAWEEFWRLFYQACHGESPRMEAED